MPRVLSNVRERLIAETRRQIEENGYDGMTMRSVADGCGIGVGTAYNYFESKDRLIASYVLDDWIDALEEIKTTENNKTEACRRVFRMLCAFRQKHKALFEGNCTGSEYVVSRKRFHDDLCRQIAEILNPNVKDFTTDFVAAALVEWSGRDVTYEELEPILEKIYNK